jgi:enoyl-CoA hydratase/carnithine racemase
MGQYSKVEIDGRLMTVTINRPEVYNACHPMANEELVAAFDEFHANPELWVAIITGAGDQAFCAGNDLKYHAELQAKTGKRPVHPAKGFGGLTNRYDLDKPVIAAVNGFAMGGGFMLVERTDLRLAVREAVFEVSEAKRWLLGGYNHGHIANVSYPIAMEMALGFRFTAQRFYEIGFLNRVVDAADLMPEALKMAEHLLTLPPASRVNTVHMMRQMRPAPGPEMQKLADALHEHGAKSDLMESRAAFAEKRKPNFKGWNDPEDRYRLPTLNSVK